MKWDFLRNRIRDLCDKNGINTKDLCVTTGIKYTTFLEFMNGITKTTSLDNIEAVACHFNVSLDYLVREEITNPTHGMITIHTPPASSLHKLIVSYSNALPSDQNALLRFADFVAASTIQESPDAIQTELETQTDEWAYAQSSLEKESQATDQKQHSDSL